MLEHHQPPRCQHASLWIQPAHGIPSDTGWHDSEHGIRTCTIARSPSDVPSARCTSTRRQITSTHAPTTIKWSSASETDIGHSSHRRPRQWTRGNFSLGEHWDCSAAGASRSLLGDWDSLDPAQQDRRGSQSTAAIIIQLVRGSLETWYTAIWLPRCQRTIEQERACGQHQGKAQSSARCVQSKRGTPSPIPSQLHPLHPRPEDGLLPFYLSPS